MLKSLLATIVKTSAVMMMLDPGRLELFKKLGVSLCDLQLRPTFLQTSLLEELTQDGDAVHCPGCRPAPWLCTSFDH